MDQHQRPSRRDREAVGTVATFAGRVVTFTTAPNRGRADIGRALEEVELDAFAEQERTTGFKDVRFAWAHTTPIVLAVAGASGAVWSTPTGLDYRFTPPDNAVTEYAASLVASGDMPASSMGFVVLRDEWTPGTRIARPIRRVLKARLIEISIVHAGAYPQATATLQRASGEPVSAERRIGKVLSTASLEHIQKAMDALQALMHAAGPGSTTPQDADPIDATPSAILTADEMEPERAARLRDLLLRRYPPGFGPVAELEAERQRHLRLLDLYARRRAA